MPIMSSLQLLFLVIPNSLAAYCGTSAIPYRFEVLTNGGTVLGCARPRCFGWDASCGSPASRDELFQIVNGQPDGFLKEDTSPIFPFLPNIQQTAICISNLASCLPDQWVGGVTQAGRFLSLVCCHHPLLYNAENVGISSLRPGEFVVGGESGYVFEYIQNVVAVQTNDGILGYDVSVKRISCLAPQPMPTIQLIGPHQHPFQPLPSQLTEQAVYGIQSPETSPNYFPLQTFLPSGSLQCFAADSLVRLKDGSLKRMDQLTMSEWIKSPAELFNTVGDDWLTNWLHRNPEEVAEFIVVLTESKKSLKITGGHYLYRVMCSEKGKAASPSLIPARTLRIGDCVLEEDGKFGLNPVKVTKLSTIIQKGIYTPLTSHGSLMVDGIAVSCLSETTDNTVVHTMIKLFVRCTGEDSSLKCNFERSTVRLLLNILQIALPEALPYFPANSEPYDCRQS